MQAIKCSKKNQQMFPELPISYTVFMLSPAIKLKYSIQVWKNMSVNPALWRLGQEDCQTFTALRYILSSRPDQARGRIRHLLGENERRKRGKEGERKEGKERGREGNKVTHIKTLTRKAINSTQYQRSGSLYLPFNSVTIILNKSLMLIFLVKHLGRFYNSTCCPITHLIFWFHPYWL